MTHINYPKIDKLYKHYKGGTYRIITLAKHTETDELLVIYQSIEFGSIHARPLKIWFDNVTTDDNTVKVRFSIFE